jgi:hypothetical protein
VIPVLEEPITFIVFTILFDIITTLGNGLVIVSFIQDSRVRVTRNWYILNLAVSDLIIALVSMPFFITKHIMQEWVFGREFCAVWAGIDLTCRLETVFSILLITHDRYTLVKSPISYHVDNTKSTAAIQRIILTWLISLTMRVPFVIFTHIWLAEEGYNIPCSLGFELDPPFIIDLWEYDISYTTISVMIEYVLPLCLITAWNVQVFRSIRQRSRKVAPEHALQPTPEKQLQPSTGHIKAKEKHSDILSHIEGKPVSKDTTNSWCQEFHPKVTALDRGSQLSNKMSTVLEEQQIHASIAALNLNVGDLVGREDQEEPNG